MIQLKNIKIDLETFIALKMLKERRSRNLLAEPTSYYKIIKQLIENQENEILQDAKKHINEALTEK